MPKISVITPVYNVEKYLDRCVESILAQTFTDFELILIDDGSPDNCPKICDAWAEKDIRIKVLHQANQGQAVARNNALDIIKGEYVAFIDSDDWVAPNFLEVLYANIMSADADIAVCSYVQTEGLSVWNTKEDNNPKVYSGREFLKYCFQNGIGKHWLLWDKLYKRECFFEIRMPVGRVYEDNATVYRLIYQSKTVVDCDACLYNYFQRPNSTVHNLSYKKTFDYIQMWQEMVAYFEKCSDYQMLNMVNVKFFYALIDTCPKTSKYYLKIKKQIVKILKCQKSIINDFHPITPKTCPQYYEIVHPKRMKIYWTIQGIKNKLKR